MHCAAADVFEYFPAGHAVQLDVDPPTTLHAASKPSLVTLPSDVNSTVIIPVDDTYAVSAATLLPESCARRQLASVLAHV